jgi:hypothetical protein
MHVDFREESFDGGRKSEKNIEHFPELMKKYRARQICKTNILQNFEKKYRAKPMKIEHF